MSIALDPDALAAALAPTLPGARVENLRQQAGGASSEIWSFDARGADGGALPLVLRRPRGGSLGEAQEGQIDSTQEFRLMQAVHAAGVASPKPYALLHELGDAIVMERVAGEAAPQKILREETFAAARSTLAAQLGHALARLHAIDPSKVDLPDPAAGGSPAAGQLRMFRHHYDQTGFASPTLELAFHWLGEHQPDTWRRTIVHGDFRMSNFLVCSDGLAAIIDWEAAHIGDPLEDLGWLCVPAWRFGQRDKPVGGFAARETLLAAYGQASGVPVDTDALRFWEVLGTLKWGVICAMQAAAHLSGQRRSIDFAALGRRVCETEYELLQMID